MNPFKRLFHFLGGIYFALALIATAALTVVVGTFLESQTESHLFAAQWTYAHPLFSLLLCLFFINILLSALRRWPFKKRHIPFLVTHLGLLIIISGTIIKNRLGLQGQLSVWEGSGNQHVLLPQTYALALEEKENPSNKNHLIALPSFHPNIYYPFHFPQLKCQVVGYAPHVKEQLESWIKGSKAYIAGFPLVSVQTWNLTESFPLASVQPLATAKNSPFWSLLALHTPHVEQALLHAYLQGLTLKITTKDSAAHSIEIPLEKALQAPLVFAQGELSTHLHLVDPFLEEKETPFLALKWKSQKREIEENLTLFLQGQDALLVQPDPSAWLSSSFTIDLLRPHPLLCLVEDEQGNNFFFAFDRYGRLCSEMFSAEHLQTLVSYDQGFAGYGVQAIVPFPTFPASRTDKEQAEAQDLILQLQQALKQQPALASPLLFFQHACQKSQVDFVQTFVQFLVEWNATHGFLYDPLHPLPPSLALALQNLEWQQLSKHDQQALQWTSRLLNQLERSWKQGEDPLKLLEKHHWPFLLELRQAFQQHPISSLNVLAQQISSFVADLPVLELPDSLLPQEAAPLLSAYFRGYGIDYRSLCPFRGNEQEQFDKVEAYWKMQSPEESEWQQKVIFETPLTHRITPEPLPLKLEDQRPGLVLEVQQGQQKQSIALAYDRSGVGLKWPILNGNYLIRFQPQLTELPYRLRLRQARQISYPQSAQVYSYESDVLISENDKPPVASTLSMNHVHETWDGYRFYLSGVANATDSGLRRIQLAVNYDPAKYVLTYPGALLVFIGILLLFWIFPSRKK